VLSEYSKYQFHPRGESRQTKVFGMNWNETWF